MRPAERQRQLAVVNPDWSPASARSAAPTVTVSLRESSIVSLAARKMLDADQVAAAWRFQRAFEIVSAIRPAVLDPDGIRGGSGDGTSDKQINAATDLRRARDVLGLHGYYLVSRICGEGYHVRDLYRTRRQRDLAADLLRIHLTELATEWR